MWIQCWVMQGSVLSDARLSVEWCKTHVEWCKEPCWVMQDSCWVMQGTMLNDARHHVEWCKNEMTFLKRWSETGDVYSTKTLAFSVISPSFAALKRLSTAPKRSFSALIPSFAAPHAFYSTRTCLPEVW